MKKINFLTTMLPVVALSAAMCVATQPVLAQSSQTSPSTQQRPTQPDNQNAQNTAAQKTFSGKIVKSDDKLVLTASGTTYQLDDQQKAQDFVNQSVKVTGSLDSSTGTIRVSAIEPA